LLLVLPDVLQQLWFRACGAAQDADLLSLAEEALLAPVPPGWTVHLDATQNEFFFNIATGQSTYEHPLDEHYRQLYQQRKAQ
jgi:hypothetical protein